jgi:hypothetical protein
MVTRFLCRSAVLSCLLFDGVEDESETRRSRAVRSARARTAIGSWAVARANNAAANTSMAESINTTNTIDINSRAFYETAGINPFVIDISRALARLPRGRRITNNDPRPQQCLAAPDRPAGSCSFSPQRCGLSANLLVARE